MECCWNSEGVLSSIMKLMRIVVDHTVPELGIIFKRFPLYDGLMTLKLEGRAVC